MSSLTVTDYRYKPEILEQLRAHGVQPTPSTRPELVHEFVNDLYRYELRRLRDRLLRRDVRKADYYDLVVEVRLRYRALALKPWQWVE
jgi:Uma2 family endonuclease